MATQDVTKLLESMKLGSAASTASKQGLTAHDMEMMSTDELARILGVSKKEAKSIKASLAKQDQGADAWAEYEKELHGPDTPGLSREASIAASEESLNIDTSGPVPPSKPLPYAPKPAPTPALGPIELDSATLQRYTAALDTIKRVQANNAETLLPQERTKLQGLQDIARCKQTEYDDLVKQTDYAMSKLKMASKGGVMGRLAHGSVFTSPTQQQKDDLKEAAQAEYDECSKKLQASKLVLDDVNADVVAQQKVVDTLQVDVDALNAAKALESQIAATIFEGSAGDAEENALEAAVHAALPALEQARADVANYGAVKEKLQGALQKFEQAEYKWDAAKSASRKNWLWKKFTGTKGNTALDLARTSQAQAGLALAKSGVQDLREAKSAIPALPKLEPAELDALTTTKWKNAFADVKVTEKQHEKDLRTNIKLLAAIEKQGEKAVAWVDKWELQKLESDYRVKKDALDVKRRALLEIELKKRGLLA